MVSKGKKGSWNDHFHQWVTPCSGGLFSISWQINAQIRVQSPKAEHFQAIMKLEPITWTDFFPEVIDKEWFCIDIIGCIWLFQIHAGSGQATQRIKEETSSSRNNDILPPPSGFNNARLILSHTHTHTPVTTHRCTSLSWKSKPLSLRPPALRFYWSTQVQIPRLLSSICQIKLKIKHDRQTRSIWKHLLNNTQPNTSKRNIVIYIYI